MAARSANAIGEECRAPLAALCSASCASDAKKRHGLELRSLHHAALNENATLGPDAYAADIGALKFRCTQRLVRRGALIKVRHDLLALLELEVRGHRLFFRLVRVLRRASTEREHPQR